MITIEYTPTACRLSQVPPEVDELLFNTLAYQVDGYFYTTKYQNGHWDGYRRLYDASRKAFRSGLLSRVVRLLTDRQVEHEVTNLPTVNLLQAITTLDRIPYLLPWQRETLLQVLSKTPLRGGIWAPPRSGKTILAIALTECIPVLPVVFFCERLEIAFQTIEKFKQFRPQISVGFVGDGAVSVGDVTIVTVQSALSAYDKGYEVEKGDYVEKAVVDKQKVRRLIEQAQMVIYDEYHHTAHLSAQYLLQRIYRAQVVVGLSGTPWREDNQELLLEQAVGPVLHQVTYTELIASGLLLRPYIYFFRTPRNHSTGAYPTVYKQFIVDYDLRNEAIVTINAELNAKGLSNVILVDFIRHGEKLQHLISGSVLLTGKEASKVRQEVKDRLAKKELLCVVTTLYGEGVDVPCHPPDTEVLLEGSRPVPISQLKVGDLVLTHLSRLRPVTGVSKHSYSGEIVDIKVVGNTNTLPITPDHRVLVYKDGGVGEAHAKDLKVGDMLVLSKGSLNLGSVPSVVDLVDFLDLQKGGGYRWDELYVWSKFSDTPVRLTARQIAEEAGINNPVVVQKYRQGSVKGTRSSKHAKGVLDGFFVTRGGQTDQRVVVRRFLPVDEKLARLLGYYIAGGSYPATFSFHVKETDYIKDVKELVGKVFGTGISISERVKGNSYTGTCTNKIIARFLMKACGKGAGNKCIPNFLLLSDDREVVRNVAVGMWRGDGHVERRAYHYSTKSQTLAYQYRFLLSIFGLHGLIGYYPNTKAGWDIEIGGGDWEKMRDLLGRGDLDPNKVVRRSKRFPFLNYLVFPIVRITRRQYCGSVYCLSVLEDGTYTTNVATIHNSLSAITIAGGGKSSIEVFQRLRSITPYPGKTKGIVVDFYDDVEYLRTHSRRRLKFYKSEPDFVVIERKIPT